MNSDDFIQAICRFQLDSKKNNDIDRYLLFTCWENVLRPSPSKPTREIHEILTRLEDLLKKPQPIAPPSIAYILHRCFQLLTIPHLSSFDQHASNIIDHLIHMLSHQPQDPAFTIIALEAFDNFANHDELRTTIKQKQLSSLFISYTSKDHPNEVRKLAFAILAQIIDEQQLTQNTNIPEMMSIFIDQLKQLDAHGYNEDIDTTLTSLRGQSLSVSLFSSRLR